MVLIGLFLSGCGRHETTGGAFGTATGAMIGAHVAGHRDKATGAILGGLIGNMIGSSAGRVADKEEASEQQREAYVRRLEAENNNGFNRWCLSCYRKNKIQGAQRCPTCGDRLVSEKYCGGCLTSFSVESMYRYCPYCREKRRLIYK